MIHWILLTPRILSIDLRRSKINYSYSEDKVTVTEKSVYDITEIETFVKRGDSISVFFQRNPKPMKIKEGFL